MLDLVLLISRPYLYPQPSRRESMDSVCCDRYSSELSCTCSTCVRAQAAKMLPANASVCLTSYARFLPMIIVLDRHGNTARDVYKALFHSNTGTRRLSRAQTSRKSVRSGSYNWKHPALAYEFDVTH